jgi:hypothetical protein
MPKLEERKCNLKKKKGWRGLNRIYFVFQVVKFVFLKCQQFKKMILHKFTFDGLKLKMIFVIE